MPTSEAHRLADWPLGAGDMIARVRGFAWTSTALGPIAGWNAELKSSASLVLDSPFPAALGWGRDLVTIHNDAFRPFLAVEPEPLGRSFAEICGEAWHDIGPAVECALAGRSTVIENYPTVLRRHGLPEHGFATLSYSPVRAADGSVVGILNTAVETTRTVELAEASKRHEERSAFLQRRVANTLGVIRAIARRSAEASGNVEDLGMHLDGRIAAFARVQAAVIRDPSAGLDLETLVAETLRAASIKEGDQFRISGPPVQIVPKAAETIGLALHELMTNAVKYGALSQRTGRIAVRWAIADDSQHDAEVLHLEWIETGIRLAETKPGRAGFGTELLTRTLSYDIDASVERQFRQTGVRYSIRIPFVPQLIKRTPRNGAASLLSD